MVGRELARSIETGILRSMNTSLGGLLANLSIRNGKGPQHIAAAFGKVATASTAMITVIRSATNAVFTRVAAQDTETEKEEPAKTQAAAIFATIAAPANDSAIDHQDAALPPAAIVEKRTAQQAPRP